MNASGSSSSMMGQSGMASTALGGITSAIGSIYGGEAQKAMYDYQAGVAQMNAQIARQNAEYAIQVGEISAQRYGMQAAQRMGQIVVAQAASGLDVRSGSNAQVQQSQQYVTEMDLTTIRSDAAKTAYNYEVQGVQYDAQAQLDTLAGRTSMTAGMIGAASSIIGTSSAVSSEWLRGQQLGLWGGSASNTSQSIA